MTAVEDVRDAAEQVESSPLVEHTARLGLAARTLVWTTIGVLALRLGLSGDGTPDQSGALRTLADGALGGLLLLVVAVGFVAWGLYRLLTAAVGHRDSPPGRSRVLRRAQALFEGVVYLVAAATTARFLLGGRQSSEAQTDSLTARLMGLPAGRLVVGAVGVVVVVVGVGMAYRALRRDHAENVEPQRTPAAFRRPAIIAGVVGMTGRGVVFALVGGFLVDAAVRFDPDEAKGLDATLQALAAQRFGTGLLLLAAACLLAFGLWSLAETIWRDV